MSFSEVPRLDWNSDEAANLVKENYPVLLENCPLVQSVVDKWNPEYLSSIVPDEFMCDVYGVQTRENAHPIYHYWDNSKNLGYAFEPPSTKLSMSFSDFYQKHLQPEVKENGEVFQLYLQQPVVQGMGDTILAEYMKFPLEIALKFKLLGGWGELTTNLLLCGPSGATTTCHYDEQQNLFAQLCGRKRVRLHAPSDWHRLYPYPLGHPRDRQAQVLLPRDDSRNSLDDEDFPLFKHATEFRVDMNPGDILFIPQYWWHQMEGLTRNVSMSWWFKDVGKHKNEAVIDVSKLNEVQRVAIRRNIERIIGQSIGNPRDIHNFFLAIAGGRLEVPDTSATATPITLLPCDVRAAANIEVPPSWHSIVQQSLQLIGFVIPEWEKVIFLKQLAQGRFSHVTLS